MTWVSAKPRCSVRYIARHDPCLCIVEHLKAHRGTLLYILHINKTISHFSYLYFKQKVQTHASNYDCRWCVRLIKFGVMLNVDDALEEVPYDGYDRDDWTDEHWIGHPLVDILGRTYPRIVPPITAASTVAVVAITVASVDTVGRYVATVCVVPL